MRNPKNAAQQHLANQVGVRFHQCDKLVATDSHGSFYAGPMGYGFWTDVRANDIAWWAVAMQLQHLTTRHIIDHAWLVSYDKRPTETWALVTEPYTNEAEARSLAILAADAMAGWEIDLHVFPASESSWNPGQCVPIVATFRKDSAETFIRQAVLWALTGPLS